MIWLRGINNEKNLKRIKRDISLNSVENLIKNSEKLALILDKIKKNNLPKSFPLSIYAENLHKDVCERINEYLKINLEERSVFSTKLDNSLSGLVKSNDGKFHILINENITDFNNELNYNEFYRKLYNETTPEDLFKNIVAHEYGHIIFKEQIEEPLEKAINISSLKLFSIPVELNEAFAYFIGDIITGVESPIEELLSQDERNGINTSKVKAIYDDLKRLYQIGKDEILDINNLRKIAIKHLYIPKTRDSDLFDPYLSSKVFSNYLKE